MKNVAVRFDSVWFSYGDVPVLSDASFHVHEGEFTALIGPNGAGKTSILRLLLGLAKPDRGTVTVTGKNPEQARNAVGYVPQHATFDPAFPISVRETVRMGRLSGLGGAYPKEGDAAVLKALQLCDIASLADRPYAKLSGGQRRRVLVARALSGEPGILVLDEPTANMDSESERKLFLALESLKGKTTIIVVTHDTAFVSALTDTILCVGERPGNAEEGTVPRGHGVVRHASTPAVQAPPELFGGKALKVLHDTNLGDDGCCGKGTCP